MINSPYKVSNIREMHFYRAGSAVNPENLFESFYLPLDELIKHNQADVGHNCRNISLSNGFMNAPPERLVSESHDKMQQQSTGWAAIVHFNNGEKKNFFVKPRTNYEPSLLKRPSIAYLESEQGCGVLILREAREYDLHGIVGKMAKGLFHDQFVSTDYTNYTRNSVRPGPKDVIVLPESPLVLGLEKFYVDHDLRITPPVKIVGTGQNRKMWYVRGFLPSMRDMSLDLEGFAGYVGALHGLGLMDSLDINASEYCTQGRRIVNIDPDLFTYTKHDLTLDQVGWGAIKEHVLRPILTAGNGEETCRKGRRRAIESTRKSLGDKTILDYIPSDISTALSLSKLLIDNPVMP